MEWFTRQVGFGPDRLDLLRHDYFQESVCSTLSLLCEIPFRRLEIWIDLRCIRGCLRLLRGSGGGCGGLRRDVRRSRSNVKHSHAAKADGVVTANRQGGDSGCTAT